MNDVSTQLDGLMEAASMSLAQRKYLLCECQCLEALDLAKQDRDWAYVARIILPLQEARRQRRLTAASGTIRLGTTDLLGDPQHWLDQLQVGCLVVTHPYDEKTARRIQQLARQQDRYVEVLFADNPVTAQSWTLTADIGQPICCLADPPNPDWIDRWWSPSVVDDHSLAPINLGEHGREDDKRLSNPASSTESIVRGPANWFLDACELLGDTALASFELDNKQPPTIRRFGAVRRGGRGS